MNDECALIQHDLGTFVDDELSGADMLRVSQHLAVCAGCAAEVETLRRLGDQVRRAVIVPPIEIAGLASSVIGRTRAESAISWRALADRAAGDWHWTIVGAGSIIATCMSTGVLSLILALGPGPERVDSLSALITNLSSPAGPLYVYAATAVKDGDSVLFQLDNGEPATSPVAAAFAMRPNGYDRSDAELVGALADAMIREDRIVALYAMSPVDRRRAEDLFGEIKRRRSAGVVGVSAAVNVIEVRLTTETSVLAKGL
jgi:hypothetical protein